jgi:hypothetical protein
MKRRPAHAGSLRISERLAFALMFVAMAAFVVGLSVIAAKSGARAGRGLHVAASERTDPIGSGAATHGPACNTLKRSTSWATETRRARPSEVLSERLSGALRATLQADGGQLSVGVIDTATGAEAVYHAGEHYHAAGIARADILAALLYRQQQAGTAVSAQDADLAAQMIDAGSGAAAARLWQQIGRGTGLAQANRALRLRHTIPGAADRWALTSTTVADQLQLLADLATARTALSADCRNFELRLMGQVAPTRRWGVPAAASPGTSYAVSDGWLQDPHRFVINSIGVINHGGHELLVAVLSQGWRTKAAGMSAVRSAALATVGAMLRPA